MLTILHLWIAVATAAASAVLVATAVIGRLTGRGFRLALDRAILVVLAIAGFGVIVGLALLLAGHRPEDGLHLVYALAVVAALPVARFAIPRWDEHRTAAAVLGGIVVVALVVRLAQTG